jgi:hypothetical protein
MSTYVAVPMIKSCGFTMVSTDVSIEKKRIAPKINVGIQNPVIGIKTMMNTGKISTLTASNVVNSLAIVMRILLFVE